MNNFRAAPNLAIAKKLWFMLLASQRIAAVKLFLLLLVAVFFEMLGIGLVIPALTLMTQEGFYSHSPAFAPIRAVLGNLVLWQLIMVGVLTFLGIYVIKTLFLIYFAWRQARFSFDLQASLSLRLFNGYLHQSYTFHLQRNSAQLIRNVVNETSQFTGGLISGLTILVESCIILGVGILLLVIEPLGTVTVVTILGLAGWGFYRITHNHLLQWGLARQFHEGMRIQHLQQGLGGAKDVKLLGREADFLAQYEIHNRGAARMMERQNTLQQLPRLWLELLAVIGLSAVVLISIAQGKPMGVLIPTLGVYAVAAFRLIPSANRVLGSIQNVRYTSPVIDTLYAEMQLLNEQPSASSGALLSFRQTLTLEKVCYAYPSAETSALCDVNVSIPCGASVGFIGGSGAGKSTLIDLILGLLTPTSGSVLVDGIDIQTNLRSWQDQIGYVPQSIFLTDDTLRRNVAFGIPEGQIDESAVRRAIRAAQLGDFVKELPQGLDTVVGERGIRLSGGQRQRIGIARALYHDPSVLVLDEATSSLDIATEQGVMDAVKALQREKTILIVAHRHSTVAHCDHIYRLDKGRGVEDGTAEKILQKYGTA